MARRKVCKRVHGRRRCHLAGTKGRKCIKRAHCMKKVKCLKFSKAPKNDTSW